MDKLENVKCIVGVVNRGSADKVVKAAKKAGAGGATIFYGRGTGETEAQKFFNIAVESSKEIILILTDNSKKELIMEAMVKTGEIEKAGTGIIFTFDVETIAGFDHRKFKNTK